MSTKKKRMGRPRVECLLRVLNVTSVHMHVSHRIDHGNAHYRPGGDAWLQLCGVFNELVEGQSEVELSVHEWDEEHEARTKTKKSIGTLIQIRPTAQMVLDMPSLQFDRMWAMASGGVLAHVWISMTKPVRQTALIVSISFSNQSIE